MHTPKPLLLVQGEPFLLRHLRALRAEGFRRILLAVHYLAPQFHLFARTYAGEFPELTVVEESIPLGTGGALRHVVQQVQSPVFLALNGDSWGVPGVLPVLESHARRGARFTMVVVRAEHVEGNAHHKGMVTLGPDEEIRGLTTGDASGPRWVNAGVYALDRDLVQGWPEGSYDLEQHFLSLVPRGSGWACASEAALLDIGTPDCYELASRHSAS
jgi:NDP-sugar pyrophosphorylase family protein